MTVNPKLVVCGSADPGGLEDIRSALKVQGAESSTLMASEAALASEPEKLDPGITVCFGSEVDQFSVASSAAGVAEIKIPDPIPDTASLYQAFNHVAWRLPDGTRWYVEAFLANLVGPPTGTVAIVNCLENSTEFSAGMWQSAVCSRFRYVGTGKIVGRDDLRKFCNEDRSVLAIVFLVDGSLEFLPEALRDLPEFVMAGRVFAALTARRVLAEFVVDDADTDDGKSAVLRTVVDDVALMGKTEFGRKLLEHKTALDTPIGRLNFGSTLLGPVDALGMRIPASADQYRNRPKNHLVIAVTGGSVAYGQRCAHDSTLTANLQKKLTGAVGPEFGITALNYGNPGCGTIDEIVRFATVAVSARPDFVVAFSGWNDLIISPEVEPPLLLGMELIVQPQNWKQAPDNKVSFSDRASVVISRIDQYRRFVNSTGAFFLYCLQPWYASKDLSKNEKFEISWHFERYPHNFKRAQKTAPEWDDYRREIRNYFDSLDDSEKQQCSFIDINECAFMRDGEQDVFFDLVHFTELGNHLAADEVLKVLGPRVERRLASGAHD